MSDKPDFEYELWQGGIPVAVASAATDAAAYAEIRHYAAVYSQDGPCSIYEVKRVLVEDRP